MSKEKEKAFLEVPVELARNWLKSDNYEDDLHHCLELQLPEATRGRSLGLPWDSDPDACAIMTDGGEDLASISASPEQVRLMGCAPELAAALDRLRPVLEGQVTLSAALSAVEVEELLRKAGWIT